MLEIIGAVVTFMIICTSVAALWSVTKWLCRRSAFQFGKFIAGLFYRLPKAILHAFINAFVPLHSRNKAKTNTNRDEHTVIFEGRSGRDIIDLNAKRKQKHVIEGEFLENPTKRVNKKK